MNTCAKNITKALLQFVLYLKLFDATPKPIEWGKINEDRARDAYIGYMRSHGHPRITVDSLYTKRNIG